MTMRNYFETLSKAFGKNPYNDFMLAHGRDYAMGPATFAGPRETPQQCFMNAALLAMRHASLTYVDGKVACHGVPLDHAWCVDANGIVVDPTIVNDDGHIDGYYGVPFRTDYVIKAVLFNRQHASLLDVFHARKTALKLYELGLEAGQQWLLDQPARRAKRSAA